MNETKYIWQDGKLVDWHDAKVHILTHGLHYGTSVFEGIRYYKTDKGSAIFRLKEHVDRLFYSASVIEMKSKFSKEEIIKAILLTCKKNEEPEGYIRPLIFYGYGKMGLNPIGAKVNTAIAVWPWGAYLSKDSVDIKTSKYIRIHPKSLKTDAKVSGHYVNSVLSSLEMHNLGYDEALMLDYAGNVAEGAAENIFYKKGDKLFTVPVENILPGITRNSIIDICERKFGIKVIEKTITQEDLYNADEAFFTGTAAEVQPIASIDDRKISGGEIGEFTKKVQSVFMDVVHGRDGEFGGWLTYI